MSGVNYVRIDQNGMTVSANGSTYTETDITAAAQDVTTAGLDSSALNIGSYQTRVYMPSLRHFLSDGMSAAVQPLPWTLGDSLVSNVAGLLSAQTARKAAA